MRHCMVIGHALGRFQEYTGEPHRTSGRLCRENAGSFLPLAGVSATAGNSDPAASLSLFFFLAYFTAVAHGYRLAVRGAPEPFARF